MNNPVGNFHAQTILQIEGDPNLWGLATLQTQDPGWDRPVAIEIGAPVEGRMILSPACSFSLTYNDAKNGWHPAIILPTGSLFLYISTATVLEDASSGYILAPQYDNLDALQESIMDAMRTPSTLALNLGTVGGGVVILSGAQLPFAVIAEGRLLRAGHAGGAHVNQER
jgi:hypothetical protein